MHQVVGAWLNDFRSVTLSWLICVCSCSVFYVFVMLFNVLSILVNETNYLNEISTLLNVLNRTFLEGTADIIKICLMHLPGFNHYFPPASISKEFSFFFPLELLWPTSRAAL